MDLQSQRSRGHSSSAAPAALDSPTAQLSRPKARLAADLGSQPDCGR